MKKLSLIAISFIFSISIAFADTTGINMPEYNPTDEINTMFLEDDFTNRTIDYTKSQSTTKIKRTKIKNRDKKNKKENNPNIKKKDTVVKETKEEILKQKQEEEKKRYRELEELTELHRQAVALYNDNNLDDAMASFIKIPENMRTAEVWLLMGNILLDKGKKDDAVFMYGRAILTDSSYYKAYYNLGNIYLSDDKFNMAIDNYKKASKYNPNNAYIYYNLGCAYLKIGELKKAKYAFIRAIELKNNIPDFHYNLAYVYKKLKKEKQAKIYLDNYNKLTGQIN